MYYAKVFLPCLKCRLSSLDGLYSFLWRYGACRPELLAVVRTDDIEGCFCGHFLSANLTGRQYLVHMCMGLTSYDVVSQRSSNTMYLPIEEPGKRHLLLRHPLPKGWNETEDRKKTEKNSTYGRVLCGQICRYSSCHL